MKKDFGITIILVVLCVLMALLNDRFYSSGNITNQFRLIGIFGIFSLGVGVVIITGGIDLSLGSMFALLGVMMPIMLLEWHWHWAFVVFAVLAISVLIGLFHAFFVTRIGVQPFIITLCGLLGYRGLARVITGDSTKGFGTGEGLETLEFIANGTIPLFTTAAGTPLEQAWELPMPFVWLIIIGIMMWVLLYRSVYGRYLFAVGKNEEATRYSGINTHLVIGSAYVLCSFLTGIGAIMLAFYTYSIQPSAHGNFYELYAIAAAVLGGCSLRGGAGSVVGIIVGTALLQLLHNAVNLLKIPSAWEFIVMALVILVSVCTDIFLTKRQTKIRLLKK
jgi:ribose transport system permease protein